MLEPRVFDLIIYKLILEKKIRKIYKYCLFFISILKQLFASTRSLNSRDSAREAKLFEIMCKQYEL